MKCISMMSSHSIFIHINYQLLSFVIATSKVLILVYLKMFLKSVFVFFFHAFRSTDSYIHTCVCTYYYNGGVGRMMYIHSSFG